MNDISPPPRLWITKVKALFLGGLLAVLIGSVIIGLGILVYRLLAGDPILHALSTAGYFCFISALTSVIALGIAVPLLVLPFYILYPGTLGKKAATFVGLLAGPMFTYLFGLAWGNGHWLESGHIYWMGPAAIYGGLLGYFASDLEHHTGTPGNSNPTTFST